MNKFEYKNLTPFKWFILENFPFIEEDFDAITEWQLFCKLGNEINKVINSQNTVGIEVEQLSNAFIELQNYINNYFDNLDVQDEVNNKLNEMAESGELEEIIAQYINLNTTYTFDTIEDLKNAENLIVGSKARTLGFYEKNDGGGALYLIREITNQDTINNYSLFAIVNSQNLVAELFSNNNAKIKISQLGIENDINTILKYAITNYYTIEIDKDITLPTAVTIETTDKCLKITSNNRSLITCLESGIIIQKSRVKIENIKLTNTATTTETETNLYCAIILKASWLLIDNIQVDSFYDAIGIYDDVMVLFTKVQNCTLSYNVRSGIYLKALATAQKNSLIFERNYLNKNGKNADNLTADGDTDIGYGIFISGGLSIKCDSNVYEYNTNCGLYVECGYTLDGFTDINGYYEQNKRTQIILNNMENAKNVSIIDNSNNRPLPNVSNALPRTDIMFYVESIYDLFNPEKNLNFLGKENRKDLFFNNTLCCVNNIKKIKDYKINDCVTQKILNGNNELSIKKYSNYQLVFPLVKNSSYKLYIKFKDNVTNPRFRFIPLRFFWYCNNTRRRKNVNKSRIRNNIYKQF